LLGPDFLTSGFQYSLVPILGILFFIIGTVLIIWQEHPGKPKKGKSKKRNFFMGPYRYNQNSH